jgi:4'-phosphopantetheinyl transferase
MALVLHKNIENGEIGLWKISEELDDLLLLAKLSSGDSMTYSGISVLHRKKEWLATRAILNELIMEPGPIKYYKDGRPHLENGPFNISITHTLGFVAVMLHRKFIPGIDIELISRKAGKVASRFLSSDELASCSDKSGFSDRLLLLHWCAKEAIFKMVPFSNIEFSTDIQISINDASKDSGSFQGTFNDRSGQIPICLDYLVENGVLLVWGSISEFKLTS